MFRVSDEKTETQRDDQLPEVTPQQDEAWHGSLPSSPPLHVGLNI